MPAVARADERGVGWGQIPELMSHADSGADSSEDESDEAVEDSTVFHG